MCVVDSLRLNPITVILLKTCLELRFQQVADLVLVTVLILAPIDLTNNGTCVCVCVDIRNVVDS